VENGADPYIKYYDECTPRDLIGKHKEQYDYTVAEARRRLSVGAG
jgi:hypothetical protein